MSVSATSAPHPVQQPTPPSTTHNQASGTTAYAARSGNASGTPWNWARDSRPAQSSYTASGTGLTVDKYA